MKENYYTGLLAVTQRKRNIDRNLISKQELWGYSLQKIQYYNPWKTKKGQVEPLMGDEV